MSLSGWTGASSDSSRSLGSTARRCAAASVDGPTDFQPELDAEVNLSERGGQPPVPAVPSLHSTGLFLLALEHATGGFSLVGVDIVGLHESPDLCHPHLARGRACRDVPAWIALAGELARRLRMARCPALASTLARMPARTSGGAVPQTMLRHSPVPGRISGPLIPCGRTRTCHVQGRILWTCDSIG